tara:strand:+ start:1243 stop:1461 length:219 start_codon:yes stop_codon:yes gene_type:complete
MDNNEKRKILKEVVRALEAIDVGASETALAILTDLAEDLLDQVDGIIAYRGASASTLKMSDYTASTDEDRKK